MPPNLTFHGHLSASIINGGEIARDLDFGSGHTAYRHASVVDVYLLSRSAICWPAPVTTGARLGVINRDRPSTWHSQSISQSVECVDLVE